MMTAHSSSGTSVFPTLRRKSTSKAADAEAKQKREAAVREAKQHVRDVVRTDWAFDPPCTLWDSSSSPSLISPVSAPSPLSKSTAVTAITSLPSARSGADMRANIVEWRMREPGSSSESDSEPNAYMRKPNNITEPSGSAKASSDPYRFENPDAIKSSILERGRRRRTDLEQEMKWNPGLRFFTERRDAWTGARKRRSVVQRRRRVRQKDADLLSSQSLSLSSSKGGVKDATISSQSRSGEGSSGIDFRPSSEELSTPARVSKALLEDLTLAEEKLRDTATTTEDKDDKYDLDKDYDDDDDVYNNNQDDVDDENNDACDYDSDDSIVPVMEPFISDSNYIRSSITPAIYTSLYSKVIVQGLTPTIPINLADLTKALVAGWKADGQWPPKPTNPPPGSDVPARRKAQSSAKNDNVTADGIVVAATTNGGPTSTTGSSGRKPSFSNQATNAVKKVLALSSHPFHLRQSSRSGSMGGETAEGGAGAAATSPTLRRMSMPGGGGGGGGDVPLVEEDETSHHK